MTEDEMVGQCLRSDQHEFNPTPGGSGRQEGLPCSGPWGHKESDMTKRLNNNKLIAVLLYLDSNPKIDIRVQICASGLQLPEFPR